MPFDDFGDEFDDGQRGDPPIVENRLGGIAETETADDNIEAVTLDHHEREIGERYLALDKHARPQIAIVELDLPNIVTVGTQEAAAQDRSDDQQTELQALLRNSYASSCLNNKTTRN